MPLHSMRKLWHKLRSSCHRKHRETKALVSSTGVLPPAKSVASAPSFDSHPALAYVNTIDATQLSNFLTWILYFETVELPEAPVSWYQYIDPDDVRGWVILGSFLVEHPNHGSELFVLDSICDRLALKRPIVYKYLKKFSSPDRMSWTQIAQVTREGEMAGNNNLEVLELVQSTLHELFDVAEHVQPTVGSMFAQWKDEIITRVRGYLSQVIAPRIAHVRLGKPLLKGSTSENLPKEVKQALRLTYLYETMLLERPVPLARYGIFPEAITASIQQRDGYDDVTGIVDVDEDLCRVERSYSSTKLRSQNRDLRATLVHLQKKNGSLVEANEKLARKLATYGRQLPNAYTRPAWGPHETSTFTLASYARAPAPGRSRSSSSSDSAAWQSLPMVSEQPDCAAATSSRQDGNPGLRRHLPDSERGSYEDLFKDLDSQPVLGRPLLHPATGQALSSHTTSSFEGNCPTFRPPRPRTPRRPSSPRSSTAPPPPPMPPSPMPPSPRSLLQYTFSSHSHPTLPTDANTPRYSPSRSSSTRSNITTLTSATTGTTSRSNSNASRLSKRTAPTRPGPCPLPAQPGRHNSIAEMQARQINVVNVQQPISPYAEVANPLDKARYAVTGIVRRKTSGVDLRGAGEEPGFGRKSSFARLGDVFGGGGGRGGGGVGEGGYAVGRRGSAREADISKNF